MIRLMHYRAYKRASKWENFKDGFVVFCIKHTDVSDVYMDEASDGFLACSIPTFKKCLEAKDVIFEGVTIYKREKEGNEFSSFRAADI